MSLSTSNFRRTFSQVLAVIALSPMRRILVAILSLPTALQAQSLADSVVHRNVDEVEVVALRQREVVAPQRLSGQQLNVMSAHSVADAVRYFSGVQLKDYGGVGGLKTVDMRSLGSNHLGVFYDGLQIGNAQNGTVDLGRFSLDNMEEIAVYNGQKSDVFQPAKDFGTSGSIYLRTRRPVFTGSDANLRVTFRTGSFGLANPSLLFERRLGSRLSLSANAEYTHAHGRYRFRYHKVLEDASGHVVNAWDTVGTRQNGDVDALRLEGSLFGVVDGGVWHLKAYYYDSERGIPRAIVRNVWTSSQRQWDRDFFVQSFVQCSPSRRYSFKASAKYARSFLRYLNPDTTQLYVDNRFTQHSVYASSANVWHVSSALDADVSVDYERSWMSSSMSLFPRPVRYLVLSAVALSSHVGNFKAQGSLLLNVVSDHTSQFSSSRQRLTPAVFVSHDFSLPSSTLSLRAFAKRMFRMPTFNDLYYTDFGNVRLRPEYATQFNLGLSLSRSLWQLSFDAYHNDVTDKILAVPKGNSQYRWMMMNIGKVGINGLDVCASYSDSIASLLHLRLSATYTYQQALDLSNPSDDGPRGTYRGQISYIPRHSASFLANLAFRNWTASYSFIYVGERYHVSANIPENYEPSWYTHDLAVTRHFSLSPRHAVLDISAELNNLLNQQYDVVLNYPMPGRNAKLILRLTL